jgi:hypothetical protein
VGGASLMEQGLDAGRVMGFSGGCGHADA